MTKYNPSKIEKKWQKYWEAKKIYNTQDSVKGKENYMLLTEFAYPSGNLHIGHWDAFAVPDILSRYLRMKGYNVLYPTGFDAFGLPAENAAIKNGIHPEKWTKQNIAYMSKQLKSMGATFDWNRKVSTIDPEYYKWTQWIFLKFYEKGLAYRAKSLANWCPKDKTVLANEQVVNGRCDRCGTEVVQKEITQWMFKITEYADQLVDGLKDLDWPETTKLAQTNWIGRSEGAIINFPTKMGEPVKVFTTRPDTIFGATFLVVSPEIAQKWIDAHGELTPSAVKKYVQESLKKTELQRQENREKTGVDTGAKATNPLTGEEIPIWVADYVLGNYGTGAIMAVPAHDERDFEFAQKFSLKKINVINPSSVTVMTISSAKSFPERQRELNQKQNEVRHKILSGATVYAGQGTLRNSGKFDGMNSEDAKRKIVEELKSKGLGEFKKTFRLHDWILSRQRYWGVPIPMVHCKDCGYKPVLEKDLPVQLPPLADFKPTDDGRSPLAKAEKWLKVKCPRCGGGAERETDTMDTFVDSSWYFLRYTDPKNKKQFADPKKLDQWLPVPMYSGGAEHNTMHLLYSRFFIKALHDLGYLSFSEPYTARRNHGVVLDPTTGEKMSKSKGHAVDPDAEVAKYGADSMRMYLAFAGPYDQNITWNKDGLVGVYRFLNRVWNFVGKFEKPKNKDVEVDKIVNKYIKTIGEDIAGQKFNTGVSGLMKLLNEVEDKQLIAGQYETILKLLAPFAPHLAEELWQGVLKNKSSIHLEKWPEYDEAMIADEAVDLVIQVNGKLRDTMKIKKGMTESEIKNLVLGNEKIKNHIAGKEIKKFIYVKDRLTNIVIPDNI